MDDDRQLLAALQHVLEMEGHSVLSVGDGSAAIEALTDAQDGEAPPFDVEASHLATEGFVDRILAKPLVLSELRLALADLTAPVA